MGTDNLFYRRKERKAESLRRRQAMKAPYDVVLIVCEGKKTEPNYFNELKKAFRLSNANIKVSGHGADPLSVVNFAIESFREEPEFDRVYCVFDRDRHTTYPAALDKIRHTRLGKGSKIFAIPSVPCFEFWLLLHFRYTTRPFDAPPGDSICSKVIGELKNYLPTYRKGDQGIFYKIKEKLDDAITNAQRVKQYHQRSGTDNPSTAVHSLVEYLMNLKKT
ncbi:MAG: RloB domain-containing protein [Deltaproteobacteria bacterium]|nr:RloB domain-containing protein [Deltaproteobacteria bacterium]MBW1949369.1 RloB domain-containing protein [Deltaproteobacteria bacterium]MBW2007690.1 RloB domain-containing protein [Deltaproteobacteria bacterium]